jgi:serine/threonine protein kinase
MPRKNRPDQAAGPWRFAAGSRIGPYLLLEPLGRGGFGEVWLAQRHSDLVPTRLALKLPLDVVPDLDAVRREADAWVKVSEHPNVLPLFEVNCYDGQAIIASQYAPQGSLKDWLDEQPERKAPGVDVALRLMQGILLGLQHLHDQGIVHRDLKPGNVLMTGDVPRLADFGLARVLSGSAAVCSTVAGTPAYMPPEAFSGDYSVLTDVWSAGVILYQLLGGALPFPSDNEHVLIHALMTAEPAPLPASVPSRLRDAVAVALSKDVSRRFQSAEQMRAALTESVRPPVPVLVGPARQAVPGWGEFIDPDGDCAYNHSRGAVTLFVPGRDHDLMAERGKMNAPRILRPVEGDFIVQVHVSGTFSPLEPVQRITVAYHGAGLLLMQDEGTYVRLERACYATAAGRVVYVSSEIRLGGQMVTHLSPTHHPLSEGVDVALRLERIGDRILSAFCPDGGRWVYLDTKALPLTPALRVGVAAINTSAQVFAPELRVLRLFRCEGPCDTPAVGSSAAVPHTSPPLS